MSNQLTDEQLLACPEPVELRFIHRGRRDLIANQAGEYFKEQDPNKYSMNKSETHIQNTRRKAYYMQNDYRKNSCRQVLYFRLGTKCKRGKAFQFFKNKRPGLLLYILIISWSLSVIITGCLSVLSAYVLRLHVPAKATGRLSFTLVACHTKVCGCL